MLDDLQVCAPGDVVLLQASGQNPTGLDLPAASWTALASLCQQTGAVPLVMVAAPGLARGTRADMDGCAASCAPCPRRFWLSIALRHSLWAGMAPGW